MSATVLYMSMTVDGFIAGPNEGPGNGLGDGGLRLHDWVLRGPAGATGVPELASTGVNAQVVSEFMSTGAVVAGRGTFEPAGGWGGDHHDGVPIFVLSREEPGIDIGAWPLVTYTTDVEAAFAEARAAAGDKDILVHGAATAQLALAAGILDELELHVIPVLFGQGRRLFDNLAPEQIELEPIRVLAGEGGVTHLRYRVQAIVPAMKLVRVVVILVVLVLAGAPAAEAMTPGEYRLTSPASESAYLRFDVGADGRSIVFTNSYVFDDNATPYCVWGGSVRAAGGDPGTPSPVGGDGSFTFSATDDDNLGADKLDTTGRFTSDTTVEATVTMSNCALDNGPVTVSFTGGLKEAAEPEGPSSGLIDPDPGAPKAKDDPGCQGTVTAGDIEGRAACWRRRGDVFESRGRARINGIDLNGRIRIDRRTRRISSVGAAQVSAGPVQLLRAPLNWRARTQVFKAAGGSFLGLPVKGAVSLAFEGGRTKVALSVGAPDLPKLRAAAGTDRLSGDLTVAATNDEGLVLDSLKLKLPRPQLRLRDHRRRRAGHHPPERVGLPLRRQGHRVRVPARAARHRRRARHRSGRRLPQGRRVRREPQPPAVGRRVPAEDRPGAAVRPVRLDGRGGGHRRAAVPLPRPAHLHGAARRLALLPVRLGRRAGLAVAGRRADADGGGQRGRRQAEGLRRPRRPVRQRAVHGRRLRSRRRGRRLGRRRRVQRRGQGQARHPRAGRRGRGRPVVPRPGGVPARVRARRRLRLRVGRGHRRPRLHGQRLRLRAWTELRGAGHEVRVQLAAHPDAVTAAVDAFDPELVICPFLKERVPADVWRRYRTIIIHPGPPGDRGPSSLDWAISDGETSWGVTALQAVEEMDAGPIWGYRTFPMPAEPTAQERPLQRRGHRGGDRAGARGGGQGRRPHVPAPRAELRRARHPRRAAPADAPAGPRVLLVRSDRRDRAPDPRRRRLPRCADHDQRDRGVGVRRPPGPGAHRRSRARSCSAARAPCWSAPATARCGSGTSRSGTGTSPSCRPRWRWPAS